MAWIFDMFRAFAMPEESAQNTETIAAITEIANTGPTPHAWKVITAAAALASQYGFPNKDTTRESPALFTQSGEIRNYFSNCVNGLYFPIDSDREGIQADVGFRVMALYLWPGMHPWTEAGRTFGHVYGLSPGFVMLRLIREAVATKGSTIVLTQTQSAAEIDKLIDATIADITGAAIASESALGQWIRTRRANLALLFLTALAEEVTNCVMEMIILPDGSPVPNVHILKNIISGSSLPARDALQLLSAVRGNPLFVFMNANPTPIPPFILPPSFTEDFPTNLPFVVSPNQREEEVADIDPQERLFIETRETNPQVYAVAIITLITNVTEQLAGLGSGFGAAHTSDFDVTGFDASSVITATEVPYPESSISATFMTDTFSFRSRRIYELFRDNADVRSAMQDLERLITRSVAMVLASIYAHRKWSVTPQS